MICQVINIAIHNDPPIFRFRMLSNFFHREASQFSFDLKPANNYISQLHGHHLIMPQIIDITHTAAINRTFVATKVVPF
jgi:hypothetical protein